MVRLFVAGLPTEVTAEQLAQRFAPFGQVQGVELAKSKPGSTLEPGQCRGFGHLELDADEQALKRCLSLYNGCRWRGGVLRVERARLAWREKLLQEQAGAAAQERAAEERAAEQAAAEQSEQRLPTAQLLAPGMEQSVKALTLLLPESTVTRKKTMTSRPAAKKRHFAPTKGCPLAVLQWADVETSDPKRQRRLVDMSPVRQVPKKLMQSAAPAPASPQAAAEPQKGFPPKPSPGAEQAQAEQAQEAPSKQLLVPGAALQQGQQGKQPPASTARTAASGLWPSASESDSEAPAGTVDFASDEDAEKSAPGPQTQQLLARFDSDSEADTDAQPKDPGGGALLWLGPAAMRGGHQMLKGSTSESDAEYQHPELPEPQGQASPEQPAAKGIPDSDTSSGQSDLTEKRELMADHDQAAITNPADEQASDASPCPETPGGSEQVAAPEAGGLDFAEQQQADGANSEASIEIPAVLQWWQDPGCLMLQQGQAFWRGHDLKARETFIKENKQHWADSYREQRRQASKGTKASRKPNVR